MNIKKKLISKYTKSQIKEKRILKLNDFGSKIKGCIVANYLTNYQTN